MRPRFISFFSGALGLDLGLERAGFECLAASEINRDACATIRRNRPSLRLYEGDIRDLTSEQLLRELSLESGEIDAIVGGPPCQAFSTAGKRRSMDDERGNLVLHFLEISLSLNPRWLIIENVRGLLSAPLRHRPHSARGAGHPPLTPEELPGGALARVVSVLEKAGYEPSFKLYDAANFGVPQRRERLVIVAGRSGESVPHLQPTHSQDEWETFEAAVDGLQPNHEFLPLRANQKKYLRYLGPGQNWRDLPPRMHRDALGKAYLASGGRVGFLRRVAWNAPSPTLVTCPTMPATLLAHPEDERPLSVEEYKRIQGFPDEWQFEGSTSSKYRQIGNAVPIGLSKALGDHLIRVMSSSAPQRANHGLASSRYHNTSESEWRERYALTVERARRALVTA